MSHPARRQRQAVCPCGSGRSLATCCLPWEEALQRLLGRLLNFVASPAILRYASDAAAMFWNIEGAVRPGKGLGPEGGLRFLEWFLCDYSPRRGQGTLLASFVDTAVGLDPREDHLLLASLLAPVRAYEVSGTPGVRIVVTDLLSGSQYAVGPISLPDRPIRSDLLVCRLLHLGRVARPGASLFLLPAACREELLVYLRTAYGLARPGRHISLEDFLDGSAHLYHHFFLMRGRNFGGRAVETLRPIAFRPGRVLYSYKREDSPRIRAALRRHPGLERAGAEGDEVRYACIDLDRAVTLATVFVRPGQVELLADSREDLAAARTVLETCLRGMIRPVQEQAGEPADSFGNEVRLPRSGIPGASFFARLLDRWADTPSLLLDNHTPRHAVQFRAERQHVIFLLANLERDMARQKRLGRAWADLTPLREQLNLPSAAPPGSHRKRAESP